MTFQARFFYELYSECGVPEESRIILDNFHKRNSSFSERSQIDECLKHEQTLPHLPEWQVLYTPGHAQSQISLYRAEDQVMIGGDHIMKHTSSAVSIEPPLDQSGNRPLPLIQYRTALERLWCKNFIYNNIVSNEGTE